MWIFVKKRLQKGIEKATKWYKKKLQNGINWME